jgi:hypothetical protein
MGPAEGTLTTGAFGSADTGRSRGTRAQLTVSVS